MLYLTHICRNVVYRSIKLNLVCDQVWVSGYIFTLRRDTGPIYNCTQSRLTICIYKYGLKYPVSVTRPVFFGLIESQLLHNCLSVTRKKKMDKLISSCAQPVHSLIELYHWVVVIFYFKNSLHWDDILYFWKGQFC